MYQNNDTAPDEPADEPASDKYCRVITVAGALLFIVGIPTAMFTVHPGLGWLAIAGMGVVLGKCALEVRCGDPSEETPEEDLPVPEHTRTERLTPGEWFRLKAWSEMLLAGKPASPANAEFPAGACRDAATAFELAHATVLEAQHPSSVTAADVMRAHQYLYYVECRPLWTDREYDMFCCKHRLDGKGGSDNPDHYPRFAIDLAKRLCSDPVLYRRFLEGDFSLPRPDFQTVIKKGSPIGGPASEPENTNRKR